MTRERAHFAETRHLQTIGPVQSEWYDRTVGVSATDAGLFTTWRQQDQ